MEIETGFGKKDSLYATYGDPKGLRVLISMSPKWEFLVTMLNCYDWPDPVFCMRFNDYRKAFEYVESLLSDYIVGWTETGCREARRLTAELMKEWTKLDY